MYTLHSFCVFQQMSTSRHKQLETQKIETSHLNCIWHLLLLLQLTQINIHEGRRFSGNIPQEFATTKNDSLSFRFPNIACFKAENNVMSLAIDL